MATPAARSPGVRTALPFRSRRKPIDPHACLRAFAFGGLQLREPPLDLGTDEPGDFHRGVAVFLDGGAQFRERGVDPSKRLAFVLPELSGGEATP